MAKELNSYDLSRTWFNWCFENPTLIKPNHTALYFFCIEHCNRLGWKKHFGLPTTMTKEAIGIRSYNTFIGTLNDLVTWGFLGLIEKSRNQYSSNIIAILKNDKATTKALDKALIKHGTKQSESTGQSIGSIDKPITINNKQLNKEQSALPFSSNEFLEVWNILLQSPKWSKKPESAINASLKKLKTQTEADAIQMIENAIAGNWQGIFELKPHERKQQGKVSKIDTALANSKKQDELIAKQYGT